MSEINGPQFGVNQINYNGIQKISQQDNSVNNVEAEAPKINDFSNPGAEALGRSMLFKANDDTKQDLKALLENPQLAENSDKTFETAYKVAENAGVQNPYEEAATFSTGVV